MACSMNSGVFLSDSSSTNLSDRNHQLGFSPSIQFANSQFLAQPLLIAPNQNLSSSSNSSVLKSPRKFSVNASYYLNKSLRWWEKTIKPNMIEIKSANELVDTLKNSGDRLVVIDFYSPACGGCKALHPKICQLAESNPDAIFLKVNNEELNKMCHALHIHVLPFFRFYKGSKGRLCSFSCTVSTIKKFREALALAKHKTEVQSNLVGPSKGLEESELIQLASVGEISLYPEKQLTSSIAEQEDIDNLLRTIQNPTLLNITQELFEAKGDNSMLVA